MTEEERKSLEQKCRDIRYLTMDAIGHIGVGHVGGSMSMVEILVVLYYKHMRIDPSNPKKEGRDRYVMSKGHAGPALYSVLADKGYFPKEMLHTLNGPYTNLPSHCDMLRTPGIDMTTGSLGQGFSASIGVAIGARLAGDGARVYSVIGDGESQEGQVWEAAMYAAHMKLDNLISFTDYNKQQLDGLTNDVNAIEPLVDKWQAFGWHVFNVDGHSVEAIDDAIIAAKEVKGKPSMIICNTVKGKGISWAEEAGSGPCSSNHNMPVTPEQVEQALAEILGASQHV